MCSLHGGVCARGPARLLSPVPWPDSPLWGSFGLLCCLYRGRRVILGWEPHTVDSLFLLPQLWGREAQKWAIMALGLASAILCRRKEFLPWLDTQEAHQPLFLAAEVVERPVPPHFRPCPSSSCSRPDLQCPQPPAGLPAPAHQASAAPAGLQALARLPLQWRHPAQSLPQLQHGTGWAGGWGHAAKLGGGQGMWSQRGWLSGAGYN